MPNAHVTVQPTGHAIATTSAHRLARRTRPLKKAPHCSSPIATPKAVANTHSGPTLRYLRSTNHWAAPITAPAKAPPSAPDTAPSTGPTTTSANSPPTGKPRKASIHHRKNRHPAALGSALALTTIAPHPQNLLGCESEHLPFSFLAG